MVDHARLTKITQTFDRAAANYDTFAVLQREIGMRMYERLDLMAIKPSLILDIGCGTGYFTRLLQKRYKKAKVIGLDLSTKMLKQAKKKAGFFHKRRFIQATMETLPVANHSVDMIFSNLVIHWHDDIQTVLQEWCRVLKPNGLLMFTTVGPDTLKELRQAGQTADGFQHVNQFMDMHDVGDALIRARFAEPVMDIDYFELVYNKPLTLLQELHQLGVKNIHAQRNTGLTSRKKLQQILEAYESYRNPQGKIPATYEIVYGHAWAPTLSTGSTRDATTGEINIPLSAIRHKHG